MRITVQIDEVSLASAVEQIYTQAVDYGSDGSPEPGDWHPTGARTLGDLVAEQLIERLVRDDSLYSGLRRRYETIRDEEIRARVAPLVAEAIAGPVVRTNGYGEPIGDPVPLRDLIVKETRAQLTRPPAGRGGSMSVVELAIAEQVKAAFLDVIAAEVKVVKDAVSRNLATQAAGAIEQVVKNALAGR